jgi:hypothetical protein
MLKNGVHQGVEIVMMGIFHGPMYMIGPGGLGNPKDSGDLATPKL